MFRMLALILCCATLATPAEDTTEDIFASPTVADVPVLIDSFEDSNIRLGASKALATIGKPAVPRLIEALRSDKLDVQIWSAYTLGKIGPDASTAALALAAALRAADDNLQAVAARSLGQIGGDDAKAIDALAKATSDGAPRVRKWSVISLGQIGSAANAAVPQLTDALDDHAVRAYAVRSLVQIGKGAIPRLTEALADDAVRLEAAEALRAIDPAAAKRLGVDGPTEADLKALRMSLHDQDKDVAARTRAAQWLGKLGLDAAPILVTAFADDKDDVVQASSTAFGEIESSAVPLLRETCKHESAQIRAAAVDALAAIGSTAKDAVPELIEALSDADRDVRYRAVKTLGVLGPGAEPAIPDLIVVMQNPRDLEATRQLAIKTIARFGSTKQEQIIAALRESTEDSNFGVSSLAKQMLKTIEAKPEP